MNRSAIAQYQSPITPTPRLFLWVASLLYGGVLPAVATDALQAASAVLLFVCIIACCASVVVRFRRARGIERQQLKWLILAGLALAVPVTGVHADIAVLQLTAVWDLSLACIPVAVGIAILRYRLFNIDLIINRTLVYGPLTVTLASLYFGVVVVVQTLIGVITGEAKSKQPAIIAVTTLIIAALFQPLCRRIQGFIDHRFYRRKYDAARTLYRFGETLRSEVELEALHEHLLAAVEDTM